MGAITATEDSEAPGATSAVTVGLLSSDIEGSTRLLQQLGPAFSEVLLAHRRLLRTVFKAFGGQEQSTEGDAFFVTFQTASDAVAAALSGQLALRSHEWPPDVTVRVRMGVHVGEIQTVAGTIMGMAVHEAARIGAVAHGGQVLVSAAAVGLVGGLPDVVSWRDLGSHRLKDIGAPIQLFQLVHPDLPTEFEQLRGRGGGRKNLPAQTSAFIGREREVSELDELIGSSRLVTVTGAGGAGKSRIALRVAAEQGGRFEGGIWFVDLAPISDSAGVSQEIIGALGLPDTAAEDLAEAVGQRQMLLVIDNCEHVVAPVADVVEDLLRRCEGVKVFATSREPLGLPGEVVWRLPSLDEADAMELFATRARAVNSRFVVTESNRDASAEICRRLDAIPLALELAAARLGALSVEQLAGRLDQRFRLLAGGARGAMARQRTLEATVDWSYDLLDDREKAALRRLGVFVGGFTLEAAEAVCATEELDAADVFDLVDRLVAKSLVLADERDGVVRYRLLETIRHYALDRLIQAGELAAARDAHLGWAEQLALAAESPLWFEGGEREYMVLLDDEHANLRAAFDWAVEGGHLTSATSFLWPLLPWFLARGRSQEGHDWCTRLLAAGGSDGDRAIVALAEFLLGGQVARADEVTFARIQRDTAALEQSSRPWLVFARDAAYAERSLYRGDSASVADAVAVCQRAVDGARSSNAVVLPMTLNALASAHLAAGDLDAARAAGEEALALVDAAGISVGQSRCAACLSMVALRSGDLDEAWRQAERAVQIARSTGDLRLVVHGTHLLARVSAGRADLRGARDLSLSLIDVVADVATDEELGEIHNEVAWYALLAGDREAADSHATRAVQLTSPSSPGAATRLHTAGEAARANGDLQRAWDLLLEAGRLCRVAPPAYEGLFQSVLEGLAGVRMELGDAEGAALLLASAAAHRNDDEIRRQPEQQLVSVVAAKAQSALDEERFRAVSNEGAMLDLGDALAAAEKMP